jgi:uncharacterized protein
MSILPTDSLSFATLRQERYINLVTYRRSGESVKTPIWFVLDGETIVCHTGLASGKIKRLRHTTRVTVAACTINGTPKGPVIVGAGQIITDSATVRHVHNLLRRKYGIQWLVSRLIYGTRNLFRRATPQGSVVIAITPV